MKKCPHCAEEIQEDAKVCGQCQSDLTFAPPPGQPVQPVTSKKAIASLTLIILSVIFRAGSTSPMALSWESDTAAYAIVYGLYSLSVSAAIFAIIYGHKARRDIRRGEGRLKGAGIALAGLMLGYACAALIIPSFPRLC